MIEIRWHGRGGQGAFTASKILGAATTQVKGLFSIAFPAFGPERRGAPIQAYNKIAREKINDRSEIKKCDFIVILDESLFADSFLLDLKPNGRVILNTADAQKYNTWKNITAINATAISLELLKTPMTNTTMLGALIGASDLLPLDAVYEAARKYLSPSHAEKNITAIERAYKTMKEHEQ